MTIKVNGAAYPGVWVEKQVAFIKLTFSSTVVGVTATHMYLTGTTTQTSTGSVGDTSWGIVESAIVQALKQLELKATVLGVSDIKSDGTQVDVMVGFAEGYFSDVNGVISTGNVINGAKAVITSAAGNTVLGQQVDVVDGYITFSMSFAAFDGNMPVATLANGDLELVADGATPGSATYPMGQSGYYPVLSVAA